MDTAASQAWIQGFLSPEILGFLKTAGNVADQIALPACVVGGFARDLLVRVDNQDIDLVVEGDGIQYAQVLAEKLDGKVGASHPRFGTACLLLPNQLKVDVVSARSETYPHPGALPKVRWASLRDDLFRRDFTINAMALRINPKTFGEWVDYFGGEYDLQAGLIRVLTPESFEDDPTRIFRAIRFEQRFHFQMEPLTEGYLRQPLTRKLVSRLSAHRIFTEWNKIFQEDQPHRSLERLQSLGMLVDLHPSLVVSEQTSRWFDSIKNALTEFKVKEPMDRAVVYWMGLLNQLTESDIKTLARRYPLPRKLKEALLRQKISGEAVVIDFLKNHFPHAKD